MVLPALGMPPADAAAVEAHLLAVKVFPRVPDRPMLCAVHGRLMELARWNDHHRVFDPHALNARLDRAWDELLHHMPRFGVRAVWAYLRCGARLDAPRLWYLLRALMSDPHAP
jgi:hypothetical protein